ncbi:MULTISPECIES: RidA family protein [Enterococcus]|uniref:RidA family protein n=1 Tax=Enterococcus casseliflavus TaxID=37734 RepID=A0A1G9C4F9_ENTCA|nr:Rid family hydrolase [Enterococcus casseliflavus]MBE9906364.1 RidA family protein [Enterococcus casseliflavus]RHK07605.1 RidA family protein [Enterococcus casseliflavus]SDK46526.1 2-iminobutanoate/2-iminopropanoate deaminase [Enterococcus casseliflavus]
MTKRQVIQINGSAHENPIPTAVKIGNMVYTSALMGTDPSSGQMPETVEEEVAQLFTYILEIMEKAGGSSENIAHLSVSVTNRSYKEIVNKEWLKLFPDPDNRPARHTTVHSLKPGVHVQVEMVAVL